MKRLVRIICLLAFTYNALPAFSQIPNGDFSNWTVDPMGFPTPVGWTTSSSLYNSACVVSDADRTNSGGYSLMLTSLLNANGVFSIDPEANLSNQPFPGVINPTHFSGFWKFDCQGGTATALSVQLFDASNAMIGQAIVGVVQNTIPNWTAFNQSITYTSNNPVTSYSIKLWMEHIPLPAIQQATTVHVDDLSFDFNTSVESATEFKTKLISLGDSRYRILLSQASQRTANISVIDMDGRLLFEQAGSNDIRQSIDLDLSSYESGMYYCVVENGANRSLVKMIVSR